MAEMQKGSLPSNEVNSAERMQFVIIRLVRHHDHRPLATAQDLRHLHVQIRDAIQYIDDEQDHVRLLDSHFYLLVDLLLENILRVNHPSPVSISENSLPVHSTLPY